MLLISESKDFRVFSGIIILPATAYSFKAEEFGNIVKLYYAFNADDLETAKYRIITEIVGNPNQIENNNLNLTYLNKLSGQDTWIYKITENEKEKSKIDEDDIIFENQINHINKLISDCNMVIGTGLKLSKHKLSDWITEANELKLFRE
jgi:hypothetical protein